MKFFLVALGTFIMTAPAMAVQPAFNVDTSHGGLYSVVSDARDLAGAEKFVQSLSTAGIEFLKDKSLDQAGRKAAFKSLLETRFDIEKIGQFSMGRYWRTATSAQQSEYQKLFKTMLVDVYTRRFENYQGQTLKVGAARAEGTKDIIVASTLVAKGQPDVSVDWRVRKVGNTFKVIDVIVEGVSMAVTQRADFSSVIQRGGGDVQVLIDHLKK